MLLSGSNLITPEDILENADLNDTSTCTESVDISSSAGVYMQVITTGTVCEVTLQVSGNGTDWNDHHTNTFVTGNGGTCVFPVIAYYARLKVTKAEGSSKTGTLIIQAK